MRIRVANVMTLVWSIIEPRHNETDQFSVDERESLLGATE